MVKHMADLLTNFQGDWARTRCFLHITNLTAQSLLHEFDVKAVQDVEEVDDDVRELLTLANEYEEQLKEAKLEAGDEEDDDDDGSDDDDDESWVDEVQSLTGAERERFENEVRPVKMVLVKVSSARDVAVRYDHSHGCQIRRLAFKIVHSTTKILPAWHGILEQLDLPERLIPRDVKTRWNSSFDMLNVAIDYREALDALCATREHGLRAYELTSEEWAIATELRDVLKV